MPINDQPRLVIEAELTVVKVTVRFVLPAVDAPVVENVPPANVNTSEPRVRVFADVLKVPVLAKAASIATVRVDPVAPLKFRVSLPPPKPKK